MFLLYYLSKFIFTNKSSAPSFEYNPLAEAVHNYDDIVLRPPLMAHLFTGIHIATTKLPLNVSAPAAFWMIQILLQVYFRGLHTRGFDILEDHVLAIPRIEAQIS